MSEKPTTAGPEEIYQRALDDGRFIIQRCQSCSRSIFYPRTVCPHCGETELAWVTPSGEGHVYSTTTVRRKAELGGDYNVSIIELAEGVRMMSTVRGIPANEVAINAKVRAKVVKDNGGCLVVFEIK